MTSTTSDAAMPVHDQTDYMIDIAIEDEIWNTAIQNIEKMTHDIISETLKRDKISAQTLEVSILLTNDAHIQMLNKTYRHKDKTTNVLSFPQTEPEEMDAPFLMLGDIAISYDTIRSEAEEQNKELPDHYAHMLVHGCLHLLHYDHLNEKDAHQMESTEIEILNQFGVKNPYSNQ